MATVGIIFVKVTVELLVQPVLVIVHLKTAGLEVTVTVLVREVGVVIVAAPLTTDHAPVAPVPGALAAMVKALLLHFVWFAPALDTVGITLVKTTVAVLVHVPLAMVHLSVAGLVVTVTVLVGEFMLLMVAAPLTTVQVPVSPVAAALAANVNKELLQLV